MDFVQFITRTSKESSNSDHLHTEFVRTKFSIGILHLDNHHQFFFIAWSMCPDLAESNSHVFQPASV